MKFFKTETEYWKFVNQGGDPEEGCYLDNELKAFVMELNTMPFDYDGCHATGIACCEYGKNILDPGNWWNQFEDENGYFYGR